MQTCKTSKNKALDIKVILKYYKQMENILVLKQTFIQQIIAFNNFSRKLFLKNNYQVGSV